MPPFISATTPSSFTLTFNASQTSTGSYLGVPLGKTLISVPGQPDPHDQNHRQPLVALEAFSVAPFAVVTLYVVWHRARRSVHLSWVRPP
jgi:hypothetical protein